MTDKNTIETKLDIDPAKNYYYYACTDFVRDRDWWESKLGTGSIKYLLISADDRTETEKLHWHVLIKFKNGKCHGPAKRWASGRHISPCFSHESFRTYCLGKGEPTIERGTWSRQGERTDLKTLVDKIKQGEITVDEILLEQPDIYHQYGRTLMAAEDAVNRKKKRTEMTEGIWLWGPTGAGKSHAAWNEYIIGEEYEWRDDKGWWDGYRGEETVLINEFRGGIPYSELLSLCDKWPHKVSRRNREPYPFTSKRIVITSSEPPNEVYKNLSQHDSLDQLKRRFKVIYMPQRD